MNVRKGMQMKRSLFCLGMMGAACWLSAAERVWQATGDGAWSDPANWAGGVLPGASDTAVFNSAITSDVTVTLDAPEQAITKLHLQNATAPWRRTFQGILAANEFVMSEGSAVLRGEWRSPAAVYCRFGNVAGSPVRFDIGDGGALIFTNGSSLYLANSNAAAQVFVRPGGQMRFYSPTATARGLYVGRESGTVGAVVQSGGYVEKNTSMVIGYGGHGVYEMTGGEFYHPYGNSQTRWRIGMNGPGFFYLRNGKYKAGLYGAGSECFEILRTSLSGMSYFGLVYCDGGEAAIDHNIKFNFTGTYVGADAYAGLTVAGNGRMTVRSANSVILGNDSSSRGRAVVNLNGRGVLRAGDIYRTSTANTLTEATLNFDGGTFDFLRGTNVFDRGVNAVIYGGGAKIGANSTTITVKADSSLRLAQGSGVGHVTLMDGGSGYHAPPIVALSGGGGAGATAAAFIDYDSGTLTGLVVTCRGENYTGVPTVVFTGGGGSGASATASLSANTAGALSFMGPANTTVERMGIFNGEVRACGGSVVLSSVADASPGMPAVTAVRMNGGRMQVGSGTSAADNALDNLINPAASLFLGGDLGGGQYRQMCGPTDNVHSQHVAALKVNVGKNSFESGGVSVTQGDRSRLAMICAELYDREAGGLVQVSASHLANFDIKTGVAHLFGTAHPVLAGAFLNTSELLTVSPEGVWAPLTTFDEDDFGPDKNYLMTAGGLTNSPTALAVNSMQVLDAANVTLSGAGTTVLESGMLTVGDGPGGSVIGGGALTSGNGRELIVYDTHDNNDAFRRRNLDANNVSLTVGSLIADNGASPVAFAAVGPADVSSMLLAYGGCRALTQPTNTYSGGTRIIDAALEPAEDRSLGVVPCVPQTNIVTSGMAMLRAKKNAWPLTLHANRGINIRGGCLALIGDDGTQTGKSIMIVNGPISGTGALVLNHWAGGGVGSVIELNGDNSAFEGTYAVHGILRAQAGLGLSHAANLALCGHEETALGTKAGGIVEMSGVMQRAPGTGPGQVQWCEVNQVYPGLVGSNDPAESGGFSAYGGPLTVNLGGDRRLLTLGKDGFKPTVLRLQTDAATDDLTWENPIDLAGVKLSIQVARSSTSKRVFWRGAISNSGEWLRSVTVRQNGKLFLCDGADLGSNILFTVNSSLQCLITNRQTLACDFTGTGPLTKWGAGMSVAVGASDLAGAMRIYEGAWFADGPHTMAGAYTVSNNAVLGGSGQIAPAVGNDVTVDGQLAPGAADGACGTLTLGSAEQATALTLNGTLSAAIGLEGHGRVTVWGDVSFGEGASVTVTAQDEEVWLARRGEEIPLLTWTGTKTGTWTTASTLPSGWKIFERTGSLALCYVPTGTMISVQ